MTTFNAPITEIIRQRFSCRSYLDAPLDELKREQIQRFIDTLTAGPFGSRPRFLLVAASEQDNAALRELGTYGLLRWRERFYHGRRKTRGEMAGRLRLPDETIILYLTSLGLGTCWLGGSFTRSAFARKSP